MHNMLVLFWLLNIYRNFPGNVQRKTLQRTMSLATAGVGKYVALRNITVTRVDRFNKETIN